MGGGLAVELTVFSTRVSLNWPLGAQGSDKTFFQRAAFHQDILSKAPRTVNDDGELDFDGFLVFCFSPQLDIIPS